MNTDALTQREDQSYTNDKEPTTQQRGYRVTEPDIKYVEKGYSIDDAEPQETFEMTQSQWREYYKKMGLE